MHPPCPLCHNEMICESKLLAPIADYICRNKEDHWFAERVENTKIIYMKMRINENERSYYLIINYTKNIMQVWSHKDRRRILIRHVFVPNFSNLDKLKNKIKTYLVLS